MATKAKGIDAYVQKATAYHIVDLANATATQVPTLYTPKDRMGVILHRINYQMVNQIGQAAALEPISPWEVFEDDNSYIRFGLSFVGTGIAAFADPRTLGIIDDNRIGVTDPNNLAATLGLTYMPGGVGLEKDYSNLPGGGLLAHPSSLFIWSLPELADGSLAGSPAIMATMVLSYVELSEDMYRELWETRVTAQAI